MIQTALVTGSSRGIGKAIALRLAKDGFTIILHGSKESPELNTTEKELQMTGAKVIKTHFDIANKQEIDTKLSSLLKQGETIDILVNNAGITRDQIIMKMGDTEWDEVIKTNLYGPFYIIKQLLPTMKEKMFGRIINVSSVAVRGAFGKANYAASKAGIISMSKSVALEVAKYNITVNTICPGFIETDMSLSIPQKYRDGLLSQIAMGRPGRPEEVANLVSFLASNQSSYITGAVIDINGGWL